MILYKLKQMRAIAYVTFLEFVRDRIFMGVFLAALAIVFVGVLASLASFVKPDRIVINFGLSSLLLSGLFMGIVLGASMIQREYERRTIAIILSRPVSKLIFITGKFCGLGIVLFLNWLVLTSLLLVTLFFYGMSAKEYLHMSLAVALVFSFFQSLLAAAISVFFSSFASVAVSTVIGIGIFILGANASQIEKMATQLNFGSSILVAVSKLLPRYELLHLGSGAVYGVEIQGIYFLKVVLYCLSFILFSLLASGLVLDRKEVK